MPITARVLYIVGACLAVAGLIAGFMPLRSGGAVCGSVFSQEDAWMSYGSQDCDALTSMAAIPAWTFLVVGAGLLFVGFLVHSPGPPSMPLDSDRAGE